MNLAGRTGNSVRLTPTRYEFPDPRSGDADWDADWIVIDAAVVTTTGSWTFQGADLLAGECPAIAHWLDEASRSIVQPTDPDDDPSLTFLEPALAFSVASYDGQIATVRVHLSHGAAPPWQDIDDKLSTWTFFVELSVPKVDLAAAAQQWTNEIAAFPPRSKRR